MTEELRALILVVLASAVGTAFGVVSLMLIDKWLGKLKQKVLK